MNGLVEKIVGIVKGVLEKYVDDGLDFYMSLFIYCVIFIFDGKLLVEILNNGCKLCLNLLMVDRCCGNYLIEFYEWVKI